MKTENKNGHVDPTKQPVRVEYEGKKFIVKYLHDHTPIKLQCKHSIRNIKGATIAYIENCENVEHRPFGIAYCSENDQYNKRKGRILATIRLLKTLDCIPDSTTL